MEIKRLNDYTEDELKELLSHWFYYYGKEVYTLQEMDDFQKMIEENPKAIMKLAILLYINGLGLTEVLRGIRGDMATIKRVLASEKTITPSDFAYHEQEFIKDIVNTYNNLEPSVPAESDLNELISMLGYSRDEVTVINSEDIGAYQESKLNKLRLTEIIMDVFFDDSEFIDGVPTSPYFDSKILNKIFIFNATRLLKYRDEIRIFINELPLEEKTNIDLLAFDKDGRKWADDLQYVEGLLALAAACDFIKVDGIDGDKPIISKVKKPRKKLQPKDPKKLQVLKNLLSNGADLTKIEVAKKAYELSSNESKELFKMLGYEIIFEKDSVSLYQAANDTLVELSYSIDGDNITFETQINGKIIKYSLNLSGVTSADALLLRTSFAVDSLNQVDDETIEGNYISIATGNNPEKPEETYAMEIIYSNPNGTDKLFSYQISKEQFILRADSDYMEKTDENVGRKRAIAYSNPVTSANLPVTLLMHEEYKNEESYSILIRANKESGKYELTSERKSTSDKSKNIVIGEDINTAEEANTLALDYLRTSRAKNLNDYVLANLEEALPGIKDFINKHFELSNYLEYNMSLEPSKEIDSIVSKFAIKKANLPNENPEGPTKKKK